jgi:hypothetical protein
MIYTCFGEAINMYDVYNVDVIGDAYMVASGKKDNTRTDYLETNFVVMK